MGYNDQNQPESSNRAENAGHLDPYSDAVVQSEQSNSWLQSVGRYMLSFSGYWNNNPQRQSEETANVAPRSLGFGK